MIRSNLCSKCKRENDRLPQAYCSLCRAAYNLARQRPGTSAAKRAEAEMTIAKLIAQGPRWPAAHPPKLAKSQSR